MTAQREIRNPYGRSVRMDILAEDAAGRRFDVEVQREKRGAVPQRARFHSGMLDSRLLKAGEQDFTKLPDVYVIFITEDDVIGQGRPVYRMERQIEAKGDRFSDGSCILYVNGAYRGEDPIGKLMHDFHCTRADDMYYPVLAERVRYLKEHREGRSVMGGVLEEWRKEIIEEERKAAEQAVKEARKEGERAVRENSKEIARRMLEEKELTEEKIAKYFGLTLEEVRKLSGQKTA